MTATQVRPTIGHVDVTFLHADAESRNKRLYTRAAVEGAVAAAQQDIARGQVLSCFACHETGLADDASAMAGKVSKVWMEGDDARARIDLFDTTAGRDIAGVVKGGGLKTVSLRSNDFRSAPLERGGERWERIDMLRLGGIDCTMTPGIPTAQIDAVALESACQEAERQRRQEGRLWESVETDAEKLNPVYEEADPTTIAEGWLPAGTTQGDLDDGDFAWLSDAYKAGKEPKSSGRKLPFKVHGQVNERGWRAAWAAVNGAHGGTDFAGGPSQAEVKRKLLADKPAGITVADEGDGRNEAVTLDAEILRRLLIEAAEQGAAKATRAATPGALTETAPLDALLLEVGKRLSSATREELGAIRDHVQQAHARLGTLLRDGGDEDGDVDTKREPASGASDAGMENTEDMDKKQLDEALAAFRAEMAAQMQAQQTQQRELTEKVGGMETQLTEAQAKLTEAQAALAATEQAKAEAEKKLAEAEAARIETEKRIAEAAAAKDAADQKYENLSLKLAEGWRGGRKVPVEALSGLSEQEGDRELTPQETLKLWSQGLAAKIAAQA